VVKRKKKVDVADLPRDVGECHAMILELFDKLEVNAHKLRHIEHVLEKMLRWRYGQRRERVAEDENQMFLFSVGIVNKREEVAADGKVKGNGKGKRKARVTGVGVCRRVWSVGVGYTMWRFMSGFVPSVEVSFG